MSNAHTCYHDLYILDPVPGDGTVMVFCECGEDYSEVRPSTRPTSGA